MVKVVLSTLRCKRCGHSWFPRRIRSPKVCPRCKHPRWNETKKIK